MGISFSETMRGHLTDPEGHGHYFDFDVRAEAGQALDFARRGRTRITGVVHAPGWVDTAPLHGELTVSVLRRRTIRYDFEFPHPDGGDAYRFRGQKDLRWLRPVHSMTHLVGELSQGGKTLAQGWLDFDLSDLPSFLWGWSTVTSFQAVDFSPRAGLGRRRERIWRRLLDRMVVAGEKVPPADDETFAEAMRLLPQLPPLTRKLFLAGLDLVSSGARLRYLQGFADLSDERADAYLDRLQRGRVGRSLLMLTGLTLKTAHFSRRDYLDVVGCPAWENPVSEPPPRYLQSVHAPDEVEDGQTIPADVVVIGTGAGGGPVAAELAERGLAVAMVEEGAYEQRAQFAGAPERRMARFWRDGGMLSTVGNVPIPIPLGRMVGGTTAINSGTCYRPPDAVLTEWREELGLPAEFSAEGLGGYFRRVETEMGVCPAEAPHLGVVTEYVARGAEAMGFEHGPLPRNAPGCDGQGTCIVGCPTDAKRSTNVSYVPRALRAGAHLFTGMKVRRLLRRGRRFVGIEAVGRDSAGAERRVFVEARAVVVACGTIHSPLLLRDNGIRLPWLGRNLSIHPALGLTALLDRQSRPWDAIPQSYGVHGIDPRIRCEGFYVPPQLAAAALPLHGRDLTRWMDVQDRVGQFGFMIRDDGVGSVRGRLGGRPFIRYDLTRQATDLFGKGAAVLSELLLRGGASEVLVGIGDVVSVGSVEEARRLAERRFRPADFRSMAFHPLGTCRIGTSEKTGVIDLDHRVFGTDNLYVMDGSSVPSSLGVNPQITIMTLATRAADALATRLLS